MSGYYDPLDNANKTDDSCVGFDPLFPIEREIENEAQEKQAKKERDQSKRRELWLANKRQNNVMQENYTSNLYTLKQVIVISIIAFLVGMITHWIFGSKNGRYKETTVGYQRCLLDTRTGEVKKIKIDK